MDVFCLLRRLQILLCSRCQLLLPSVHPAAGQTAPLNFLVDDAAACILPLLRQMRLDLQALKTARAVLGRLRTLDPGHQAAAAAVMRTQTASRC